MRRTGPYGYEILADGKLLVRQTNVPGQPGTLAAPPKPTPNNWRYW
ncbi:MAG: hypothetical protein IPP33_08340 [Flavobacteriales bacterium]|nr:hypothetical protein [Flavobacteriales bacterium]